MTTEIYTLSSNAINTTTTHQPITGLQFTGIAGTNYFVQYSGTMKVDGGNGGMIFRLNIPSGSTASIQSICNTNTTTGYRANILKVDNDATNTICTAAGTEMVWLMSGIVKLTTTGTVGLEFRCGSSSGQTAYTLANSSLLVNY